MGDMGDFWHKVKPLMKEESANRRKRNRENSVELLIARGIDFDEKNDGAHLIVKGRNCLIDFWPGTGKFIARNGAKGRGAHNLIKLC